MNFGIQYFANLYIKKSGTLNEFIATVKIITVPIYKNQFEDKSWNLPLIIDWKIEGVLDFMPFSKEQFNKRIMSPLKINYIKN